VTSARISAAISGWIFTRNYTDVLSISHFVFASREKTETSLVSLELKGLKEKGLHASLKRVTFAIAFIGVIPLCVNQFARSSSRIERDVSNSPDRREE